MGGATQLVARLRCLRMSSGARQGQELVNGLARNGSMETTRLQQRIANGALDALLASLAITLLFCVSIVSCSPAAHSDPDPTALFQAELDALREEYGFPGATAAYVLSDGTAGVVATGLSDIEAGVGMSTSSRMLAASIGKTFVSATVLALAQEARLGLDDRISLWLSDEPWFARLPNNESITIRHLLTHSAGIPNHVDEPVFAAAFTENWAKPGTPFSPEMLIEFVLDQPALFEYKFDDEFRTIPFRTRGAIAVRRL